MSDKSIASKMLGGMLWIGGGVGGQALAQLIVLMALARIVSPAEFGIVTATAVIAGLGLIFSQIGVGPAIVQKKKLTEQHLRAGFLVSVLLASLIVYIINAFSADISRLFKIDQLNEVIPYLSLIYIVRGLSVTSESLLHRELKFRVIAIIDFVSYFFGYGVTGIVLALNGYGYWSLVIAQISQAAIVSTLYIIARPPLIIPTLKIAPYRELLSFGIGITITRIANYSALQSDKLIIGRYLGVDSLGIYGRAYQLSTMPINLIGRVLHVVTFAVLSSIQENTARLKIVFEKLLVSVSIIALPISSLLFIIKDEMVLFILGDQWLDVIPIFQVMVVGLLFRMAYRISGAMLTALGKIYKRAIRQIIYALLVILFSYVGSKYGASGVAVGVLVATVINTFMTIHLCLSETNNSWTEVIGFLFYGLKFALIVSLPVLLVDILVSRFELLVVIELAVLLVVWMLSVILVVKYIPHVVFRGVGMTIFTTILNAAPIKLKRFLTNR